jgi:hypothetical protein
MDIACLPTDVQRRILRFLSHPTADLIKQQAKHLHVLYIHDGDQLPLFSEFRDDFHRFYFTERKYFHLRDYLWRACRLRITERSRYKFVRKNMGLYMNDTHSDTDSYESDYVVVEGVEPDGTHQVQ